MLMLLMLKQVFLLCLLPSRAAVLPPCFLRLCVPSLRALTRVPVHSDERGSNLAALQFAAVHITESRNPEAATGSIQRLTGTRCETTAALTPPSTGCSSLRVCYTALAFQRDAQLGR